MTTNSPFQLEGELAMPADPDLSLAMQRCAAEPIHIPGSIQPHGVLLILDPITLKVIAAAGEVEARLSSPWLGLPAEDLLGASMVERLKPDMLTGVFPKVYEGIQGSARSLDATVHVTDSYVLVELEAPAALQTSAIDIVSQLEAVNVLFERAESLVDLSVAAAMAVRAESGFDRVMVYRFLDDGSGVVLAEDKADHLGSFLNHHFPASDIPEQARALYLRNRVRVIPDADYAPAPIRPAGSSRAVDLSDVNLRSVSPVHLRYLRNMGVAASASISIVVSGRLWGLIACHHSSRKEIPIRTRTAFKVMAGSLSRAIRAIEDANTFRERLRLRAFEDSIAEQLNVEATEGFEGIVHDLCAMLNATGFASIEGGKVCTSGRCPSEEAIELISTWLTARSVARPFSTFCLTDHLPAAESFRDLASGLLTLTLPTPEPMTLMWFRAEKIEVVEWAGNPHKNIEVDPSAILNPRTSFAAWSETVRGQSVPWTPGELAAAHRVRAIIFEARQNRRHRSLNRELAATIADKESLLEMKDHLIREVDHRVQNSLQLVSSFLAMQARTSADHHTTDQLAEAQHRIAAVALVHRRLYSDGHVESVDLGRYLDDLTADMKNAMGAEWAANLSTAFVPLLMATSRTVNVGLILTELAINANKYAYGGSLGPLSISLETSGKNFSLTVADRGSGKRNGHLGFGTKMLAAMTSRLNGTLTEHDNEPGLRVCLIAPIEEAAAGGPLRHRGESR